MEEETKTEQSREEKNSADTTAEERPVDSSQLPDR
jgi:hypothetical protein